MEASTTVTAAQLRAGRALLGIEQGTVAREAGVSLATLRRAEADAAPRETALRIAEVLQRAGVRFVEDGVQLRAGAAARDRRARGLKALLARADVIPDLDPGFHEHRLYDEHGLPA